ncbi:MAG: hypothetical protein IT324_33345 [Anaerolineae bacterium]|nr:hypothetical protein [Anaerolineae bacterium]
MTGAREVLRQLKADLKRLSNVPKTWNTHDYDVFFELEAVLHLYEVLVPDQESRHVEDAWILLSGYSVPGINDDAEAMRRCLLLRGQLHYLKTASAWRFWLNWYTDQPVEIRLYETFQSSEGNVFRRRDYGANLRSERLAAYERLFTQIEYEEKASVLNPAPVGEYTFTIDGTPYTVSISEAMATFAHNAEPVRDLSKRSKRAPIIIDLDALVVSAQELDRKEVDARIAKPGNWEARLRGFWLAVCNENGKLIERRQLELKELLHFAGVLGVGKSSLIGVLTYHLVCHENRHVTVMVNTIVEAFRMADWLRRLGIAATPALGRNRADHEKKYGLANQEILRASRVFQSEGDFDPVLSWMPTPCALRGMQPTSFPVGREPCFNLYDAKNDRYACPLISVCPTHQLERDLVASHVWIVNPMSVLYSAVAGFGDRRVPLYEAIYHRSDVFIIDEADRVQVQWDRAFAPMRLLAGNDDALLDSLHRLISGASVGVAGRRKAAHANFSRLTRVDAQAHILANSLFRLLSKTPALVKWIHHRQLTNRGLFSQLTQALTAATLSSDKTADREALEKGLTQEFQHYWTHPFRHQERVFFHEWINRLLGSDDLETDLWRQFASSVARRLGWKNALNKRQKLLLKKVEFAVVLAALLKRANDVFYLLNWIGDELDSKAIASSDFEPADTLVNLIPDSPLGAVLGVRLVHHTMGEDLGVLHAMRYRGIGRWLLLNFSSLLAVQTGWIGPHVLLLSATGWLPGSSQFHLAHLPDALLLPTNNAPTSGIDLCFNPIRKEKGGRFYVSGAGKHREHHLRQIVRKLAMNEPINPSHFQTELNHWRDRGEKRSLLLVVNSYEQAGWVMDELGRLSEWQTRVRCLLPDDAEVEEEYGLRARESESFIEHGADILIAPLMAIQRGFNILDEEDRALLGTAYFLVRPFPPPDDISPQILGMNAWLLDRLMPGSRVLRESHASEGLRAFLTLRKDAYREWSRRLATGQRRIAKMDENLYQEFLRDQFVMIWQTIGRLVRGGRDARVYFVDGAFSPDSGKRRMLLDWHQMLNSLIQSESDMDRQFAESLYRTAHLAFQRAFERKEIY